MRTLTMISLFAALARGQGTADAFAAKIPAANMPSAVILSAHGAVGVPGKTVRIPLSLAFTTAPSSFQIDLNFDATKLNFVSASARSLGLTSSPVSSSQVRLSILGANGNAIASGVVATAIFTMASSFGIAATPVILMNCISADTLGNPLSTGCVAGTVGILTCNVTGNGTVGVADVQAIINQVLGDSAASYDLNQDGVVNVIDVQLVMNAAMGKGCLL